MKWTTRFDLGLSTTVPALQFEPENIHFIKDQCKQPPYVYPRVSWLNPMTDAEHEGKKVPAEKIYTDGCGFMNRAALTLIAQNMGYAEPPTAVQGRILGSKGLWLLHPHDHHVKEGHLPMIWIRPSQQKIQLTEKSCPKQLAEVHPAHFIFDLVTNSRVAVATRLSRLTLLNLAHNGVPKSAFIRLMKDGLDREIAPLTQWQGPHAMSLLWHAVNKSTGTSSRRLQQFVNGAQRAMGLSRKRDDQADDDDEDEAADEDVVTAQGALPTRSLASGKPLSFGEVVLDLIQAGFNPTEDKFLYDKLRKLVDMIADKQIKENHLPVLCSADAFIVPGEAINLASIVVPHTLQTHTEYWRRTKFISCLLKLFRTLCKS